MTTYALATRYLARLSLLTAVLLQIGGAALGPWLHPLVAQRVVWDAGAPAERENPAPAPHHEQSCAVCHSLGTVLFGGALPTVPTAGVARVAPLPDALVFDPSPVIAAPQARAPPFALLGLR